MTAQEIMGSDAFKKCEEFHGHVCPGLSIGYRASHLGMAWLRENRSADEEIVAIVETDACCADAVQVMTGCTFGKGNFIYKDYGKMAFTFLSRNSGKGVRMVLKPDATQLSDEHRELLQKIITDTATETEREKFQKLHYQRSCEVLEKPLEELFTIRETDMSMPKKARIEPSEPCARCGEPAMISKLEEIDGQKVCRGCKYAECES